MAARAFPIFWRHFSRRLLLQIGATSVAKLPLKRHQVRNQLFYLLYFFKNHDFQQSLNHRNLPNQQFFWLFTRVWHPMSQSSSKIVHFVFSMWKKFAGEWVGNHNLYHIFEVKNLKTS
jgi:hypothetical protein